MADSIAQTAPSTNWWKGAVFYQIYPRSFYDSNHDGVGDLSGIAQKLDYVSKLGVDGLWISPFYPSPMKDFGYDISNFTDVDPLFGTLGDFQTLIQKAHNLNIKVIVDLVLNHSSDQHPWFQESRTSRDNDKADWYVWVDPDENGNPPNNWVSIFGGPAWEYDENRKQYYLHNFLVEQPDLNYHNPDVQNAILDVCRFWLEQGVDGLRLDVINFLFHDQELRDNPPKDPEKEGWSSQFESPDPYNEQRHIYDKSRPECLEFAKRIRALTDEYPSIMTLAEIGDDHFVECAAEYTKGDDRYHTAYNFSLMTGDKLTPEKIIDALTGQQKSGPDSWPSWAFCNHDVTRVVTRWGKDHGYDQHPNFAKCLIALLCSLRGTIFMYQGEELGLTEAVIPFEKIQDPWGKHTWPDWQGRDGCRTPLPWDNTQDNSGFSQAQDPWLDIPEEHRSLSIDQQNNNPDSILEFTRKFLAWRKAQKVLIGGSIQFLGSNESILAFERSHDNETILCLFNLSDEEQTYSLGKSKSNCSELFSLSTSLSSSGESSESPSEGSDASSDMVSEDTSSADSVSGSDFGSGSRSPSTPSSDSSSTSVVLSGFGAAFVSV